MVKKKHKVTVPIIVNAGDSGARQVSCNKGRHLEEECLIVIYRKPTIHQARLQFWISLKMFLGALGRSTAMYFGCINRSHDAVNRAYTTQCKTADRS